MRLLLKSGIILDCLTGEKKKQDILIEDGIIVKIEPEIGVEPDMKVVELEEAYVSSGWVESHTHMGWEPGALCIDCKSTYPADGITYVVDAGTHGAKNYSKIHQAITNLPIRAKSYLYVSTDGTSMAGRELKDLELLDEKAFCKTYEKYRDEIIGVKIRVDRRVNSDITGSLKKARALADYLELPLIIHPTRCPESIETILSFMKSRDVYAHTYSALSPCILDENGQVKKCVKEARERGVWFDLSHGSSNFSFEIAKKAINQGFIVDTISTDLHTANIFGPVRSLADTMSKMLLLGMSLEEIIFRVTMMPVKMLGLTDKSVEIKEGELADLTVFRVKHGKFSFTDSYKQTIAAEKRISPVLTIFENCIFEPRHTIFMNTPDNV